MLLFRHLTILSAGAALALAYTTIATAQTLPASGDSQNAEESQDLRRNPFSERGCDPERENGFLEPSCLSPKVESLSQDLGMGVGFEDNLSTSTDTLAQPASTVEPEPRVSEMRQMLAQKLPSQQEDVSSASAAEKLQPTEQPPQNLAESLNPVLPVEPRVSEIKQMELQKPSSQKEEAAPSSPSPGGQSQLLQQVEKNPAPENLNPSANPLLFPTEPKEVEIDISQPITLEQAIELALRNNKDLQTSRLQLDRSRAELREAQAALWPTLDKTFTFLQQNNARSNATVDENNDSSIQTRERQIENINAQIDAIEEKIQQIQAITNPREDQQIQRQILEQERNNLEGNLESLQDNPVDLLQLPENAEIEGSIEIKYNVYTGGERGARIKRAERQVHFQELQVETTAQQTRFDATDAYYKLQDADAKVAIRQAEVEDTTQSLRDAQLLERAGLGTRFDVLQAEVDVARANQQLTQAIAAQRVARRELAQILSLGQQVELTAADVITEAGTWTLSLDESIVQAYKNRAELEQQLVQREIGEQNREIALAEIRPKVEIFANYQYFDDFSDGVGIRDGYQAGARLNWRFFDGGRAFAAADRENRNIDLADTEFANQRNQVRLQVERSYFELISNKENIGTSQKAVETATERLRLARLRFQAGVGTQTEVINGQRDLTQARGDFLSAIIGYNQSLNSLQRAVSNLPNNRLFELQ